MQNVYSPELDKKIFENLFFSAHMHWVYTIINNNIWWKLSVYCTLFIYDDEKLEVQPH